MLKGPCVPACRTPYTREDMDSIVISREGSDSFTQISTIFIDYYMPYANDAQLKVYLYLLRSLQQGGCTGISDMADLFNFTEKDVIRALDYWERNELLSLSRDGSGNITYVCMLTPRQAPPRMQIVPPAKPGAFHLAKGAGGAQAGFIPSKRQSVAFISDAGFSALPECGPTAGPVAEIEFTAAPGPQSDFPAASIPQTAIAAGMDEAAPTAPELPMKASPSKDFSPDEIKALSSREEVSDIFFFAEQYLGRNLSSPDIQTILFIYDKLDFSPELLDYLIQYCVDRGKTKMRYIEKVALAWYQKGVTTVNMAKEESSRYEKLVYDTLRALGHQNAPTPSEADIILSWKNVLGYEWDIISKALERAVMNASGNRLRYADRILKSWHEQRVRTGDDIDNLDKNRPVARPAAKRVQKGSFSAFPQQDYDMQDLENLLVKNKA